MAGELHLTRGIPASRKTTFAKAWVAEAPENRVRLNRDDYRQMMFGKPVLTFPQEKAVSVAQQAAAKAMLGTGMDVIIDDTNLRSKFVQMWYGISPVITFHDFPVSLEQAIEDDWNRTRLVGQEVITDYFNRFTNKGVLPPVPVNNSLLNAPKPYVPGRDKAVSFDIDGTLAHMDDRRGPYDNTKYHLDEVDKHVREALWLYAQAGYRIIIFTARGEESRVATETWLWENEIHYYELLMRPAGDTRNDAIVKSEMVDKYISGVYDLRMHFDDRDRVVDAMRAKGIKVAQVNPGNF